MHELEAIKCKSIFFAQISILELPWFKASISQTSAWEHPTSIYLNFLKNSGFTAAESRLIVLNNRRGCLSWSNKTIFPECCSGSWCPYEFKDKIWWMGKHAFTLQGGAVPRGHVDVAPCHPRVLIVLWERWLSEPPRPAVPKRRKRLILLPKELHKRIARLRT